MKLRSLKISNVRSFLEEQELIVEGDMAILVGPNGGGKTNLLDTLIITVKRYLMPPAYERRNPRPDDEDYHDFIFNDAINQTPLERHSGAEAKQQTITLGFEVTPEDIANIAAMKAEAKTLLTGKGYKFSGSPSAGASDWNLDALRAGDRVSMRIIDGSVQIENDAERLFFSYLQAYEADNALRRLAGKQGLRETLLYLPVNRTPQDLDAQVVLANVNTSDLKRQTDAIHSRSGGGISGRAIAVIAHRHRRLEQVHGGDALSKLQAEPNMKRLTSALSELGYQWSVECINLDNNTYTVSLEKNGSVFRLANASSGERQLLTYLLSIYALDIRNALIVIDEPELHLHPRWQRALLRLFEKLSVDTGNQFIMATHSPTFISPASVLYVSRVYSEGQRSRIVGLNPAGLPATKHRFDAINSQNNERIFFADLVVLVEGPSDRMVIERLIATREAEAGGGGATVEVIAVHGKAMFSQYASLLQACGVRSVQIADLDYVHEIGDAAVKAMLGLNTRKIRDAIGDPSSIDGETIVRMIDDSVAAGKWVGSREEWERIKAIRTKLKPDLSLDDQTKLAAFIQGKRADGIYVLQAGSLEAYLPEGHGRKDIDKLIALVNAPDFETQLPSPQRYELLGIADAIEAFRQQIAKANVHAGEPPEVPVVEAAGG